MKITEEMRTAMAIAEKFATAHSTFAAASAALNDCLFLGNTFLDEAGVKSIQQTMTCLSNLRSRANVYGAEVYIKNLKENAHVTAEKQS